MKTVTFVSVYVIRPAAGGWEFLQIFRSPGRYMEGTWQLVAGGIEPGEPAWQAAIREMREEVGLAPKELYVVDHVSTFYMAKLDTLNHAIEFCAIVDADANVILNNEHLHFRWVAQAQIENSLMWSGQREGCREVVHQIIGNAPSKPHCRIELAQPD